MFSIALHNCLMSVWRSPDPGSPLSTPNPPSSQSCLCGLLVIPAPVRCQTLGSSTVTGLLYFQTVKGYGSLPRHAAVSPSTLGSLNHLNPFK